MGGPLEFPPWEWCSWSNRFDDPDRRYRVLYCAEQRSTALRETLADFRPDTQAIAEFQSLFGEMPARRVPEAWLRKHVLAPGRVTTLQGSFVDLDSPGVRSRLERQHAGLLHQHGMKHLDISEIRSKNRVVTQAVSRSLYSEGAAGIVFRSNLDNLPC
jgi:hypothetical protein